MPAQSRRSILTGFCALVAAPAIVRASSLMAISASKPASFITLGNYAERILVPAVQRFKVIGTYEYQMSREWVEMSVHSPSDNFDSLWPLSEIEAV